MFLSKTIKTVLGTSIINDVRYTQVCFHRFKFIPKLRVPEWHFRVERRAKDRDDNLTERNKRFINEMSKKDHEKASLLKVPTVEPKEWKKGMIRCGIVAKKLGYYPLWTKDGTRICTTVLQIIENHVIKYAPPGEFNPTMRKRLGNYNKKGCLYIGSGEADPNRLTANYMGLFKESGVMPTQRITRFIIHPDAALPIGTSINALHYRVGDYVDVLGKTVDQGWQGVIKRWGFKGGPATHGTTKNHRRGGSLASGIKSRIWKGKKMPGNMGNRWRTLRGLKIWRINRKENCIWVSGRAIAGAPGSLVYIYDTVLPLRQPKEPLHFPTFLGDESKLPEDIYEETIHKFGDLTITFEPEK
ncbi:hypothetical protein PVAND_000721 [Polypedilum vanderplanki]|uniref:Large ribosomal subunit protein uL3m n=1 Tax=Polypedilum vanderplanki TaxID=319348 RepID=A0A9J6BL16_POLVA|nr:hypothetical protein PVAND_000721 [Polypedilum vanderplanki]